jgi:hypothetical protein
MKKSATARYTNARLSEARLCEIDSMTSELKCAMREYALELIGDLVEELFHMGVDVTEIVAYHPDYTTPLNLFYAPGCAGSRPGGTPGPVLEKIRDRLMSLDFIRGCCILVVDRTDKKYTFSWNATGESWNPKGSMVYQPWDFGELLPVTGDGPSLEADP